MCSTASKFRSSRPKPPGIDVGKEHQDQFDPPGMTQEQADTDRLLRQLLGTAIADRYVDFCRLSSGQLPLIVARPLAGHALRELDSLIRGVLAVPMDARAGDNRQYTKLRRDARRMLKKMGFDDAAVQRAGDGLKPKFSHRVQIEKIVRRLGLAPDGDVAKLWIELNDAYGRVHERSFHEQLTVDEMFRTTYARRFDTVIRAVAVQLQDRYAELMHRARAIAQLQPAKGIKLFLKEIPGALPVQNYFYENVGEDWLPHLLRKGLLGEPLQDPQIGSALRLWAWPAGRYLVRMASSSSSDTRLAVAQALGAVQSSTHPDVQQLGLDVMAALPAEEAAALVHLVEGWVTAETAPRSASVHKLIETLAGAGRVDAALAVTAALFQLNIADGQLVALFDHTMYDHYLDIAVSEIEKSGSLQAVSQFCDLLMQGSRLDRRLASMREEDYSYYMVGSLEPSHADGRDYLSAVIRAIVRLASAAVRREPSALWRVVEVLRGYAPKIYRRVAFHVLSLYPQEAPELAEEVLTDKSLVDADWCREEYGKIARAWFARLSPAQQQDVFLFIESLAADYIEVWRANFESYYKRKPNAEDDRAYREASFRDVVWEWRDALPAERRLAVEKTIAEFGGRDSWAIRHTQREQPSLDRAAMLQQSVDDTIAHLAAWRPAAGEQDQTVPGLALELCESVTASPEVFSAGAAKFAGLHPTFIRQVFDGLRQPAANGVKLDWGACLELLEMVVARAVEEPSQSSTDGKDVGWSWTLYSAIVWMAAALRRGAEGIPFAHFEQVSGLVPVLHRLSKSFSGFEGPRRSDPQHIYISAIQTARGAAIDLCLLLIFWKSRAPGTFAEAPRETLARSPDIRLILQAELEDQSPNAWISHAVLGRYLSWLFYFGEDWLRCHFTALFPSLESDLAVAAWLGHLQQDRPIADLVAELYPHYAFHIACLEGGQPPPGFEGSENRLAEYLMVLFLWEKLPDDLLRLFWRSAPVSCRRHAMWFMGREMVGGRTHRSRAMAYWELRLRCAIDADNPEPFRNELGSIGHFFLWDVDHLWLLDQLKVMLAGGFAPNDAFGVLDALAKLLPEHVDRVVQVTNALVRQPGLEGWIFAAQDNALRRILLEGKGSRTPGTSTRVREIISYLASRGNHGFLDLDN